YAVNHASALDIPVLYVYLPFQFRIVFKKELLSYPVIGWHLKRSGQICIDQQKPAASIGSIRAALKSLKAGMPLVIFPEGGRRADVARHGCIVDQSKDRDGSVILRRPPRCADRVRTRPRTVIFDRIFPKILGSERLGRVGAPAPM